MVEPLLVSTALIRRLKIWLPNLIGGAMNNNRLWLIFAGLLLAGCGPTKVTVDGTFPHALTREVPLRAGLYFDNEFKNYVHKDGEKLHIAMGKTQQALFRSVLTDLFAQVIELEEIPEQSTEADLIISPHIEEVQVSMPHDTKLKFFEVWIKYNIQVYDGNGQPIADWIMTSYGKTLDRFLASDEKAINEATVMALRDVGAQLITRFVLVPDVKRWLEYRLTEQSRGEGDEV